MESDVSPDPFAERFRAATTERPALEIERTVHKKLSHEPDARSRVRASLGERATRAARLRKGFGEVSP